MLRCRRCRGCERRGGGRRGGGILKSFHKIAQVRNSLDIALTLLVQVGGGGSGGGISRPQLQLKRLQQFISSCYQPFGLFHFAHHPLHFS